MEEKVKKPRRKQVFKNEVWFVRMPGAESLTKFHVLEVSGPVVTGRDFEGYSDARSSYEISRLEWVSRYKTLY